MAVSKDRSARTSAGEKSRRSEPVDRRRDDGGRFDGPPTPPGFGSLSSRPNNFRHNAPTFAGRRAASRQRYQ